MVTEVYQKDPISNFPTLKGGNHFNNFSDFSDFSDFRRALQLVIQLVRLIAQSGPTCGEGETPFKISQVSFKQIWLSLLRLSSFKSKLKSQTYAYCASSCMFSFLSSIKYKCVPYLEILLFRHRQGPSLSDVLMNRIKCMKACCKTL